MLHRAPRSPAGRARSLAPFLGWGGIRAAAAPALRTATARVDRRDSEALIPLGQFLKSRAGSHAPVDAHQLQLLCQQLFVGWSVRETHGSLIGRVSQVELLAPYTEDEGEEAAGSVTGQVVLCTQLPSIIETPKGTWGGIQLHRIPVAPDLIPTVDPGSKTLQATLPQGFLDLGRRQFIVVYLSAALLPYSQDMPSRKAPTPTPLSTDSAYMPALVEPDEAVRIMPSRAILEAAGREDLAGLIREAGGHAAVAAALGWASARRPHGYWDDLENLEDELAAFLDTAWLELHDERGQSTYFYNQISGEVSLQRPVQPDGSRSTRQPSLASRVMPTTEQLIAAGRTDLLHAVRMYGGVAAVAELLHRTTARTRRSLQPLMTDDNSLRQEVCDLAAELGMPEGRLPTYQQMLQAGRVDLVRVIRGKGGWAQVASQLGLKAQRSARNQLQGRDAQLTAACSLMEFMLQQLPGSHTDNSSQQHTASTTVGQSHSHMPTELRSPSPLPTPSPASAPAASPLPSPIGQTTGPSTAANSHEAALPTAASNGHAADMLLEPTSQRDGTRTPSPVPCSHRTASEMAELEQQLGTLRARLKHACCLLAAQANAAADEGQGVVALPRWMQGPERVTLPSLYALKQAGRWDLYTAIQRHGKSTLEGWCGIAELRASLPPITSRAKSSSPARRSDAVLQAVETLLIELASSPQADHETIPARQSPSPPPAPPSLPSLTPAEHQASPLPSMKTFGEAGAAAGEAAAGGTALQAESVSPLPHATKPSRPLALTNKEHTGASSTQPVKQAVKARTTSRAAQSTRLTAVSSFDGKSSHANVIDVRAFKAAQVCKALQAQGLEVSSQQVRTALLRLVEQGKIDKVAGTTGRYTLLVSGTSPG